MRLYLAKIEIENSISLGDIIVIVLTLIFGLPLLIRASVFVWRQRFRLAPLHIGLSVGQYLPLQSPDHPAIQYRYMNQATSSWAHAKTFDDREQFVTNRTFNLEKPSPVWIAIRIQPPCREFWLAIRPVIRCWAWEKRGRDTKKRLLRLRKWVEVSPDDIELASEDQQLHDQDTFHWSGRLGRDWLSSTVSGQMTKSWHDHAQEACWTRLQIKPSKSWNGFLEFEITLTDAEHNHYKREVHRKVTLVIEPQ